MGTFLSIVPHQEIILSWQWEMGERDQGSRVIIRIRDGPKGTELTFSHIDLETKGVGPGLWRLGGDTPGVDAIP